VKDIDLFEINEAFAVVSVANERELEAGSQQGQRARRRHGLGHPIGASGAGSW
jgi:acetyl-CoA C-acetyltransferase